MAAELTARMVLGLPPLTVLPLLMEAITSAVYTPVLSKSSSVESSSSPLLRWWCGVSELALMGEDDTMERYPFTAPTPVVEVRDTRAPFVVVVLVVLDVWGWGEEMGCGRLALLRIGCPDCIDTLLIDRCRYRCCAINFW